MERSIYYHKNKLLNNNINYKNGDTNETREKYDITADIIRTVP